ncbi:glycosyltransferase family 2 protein [Rhodobium gokarnense]|uniref:Glycosyltransferase involved in cell wall biosynthesis n=1 Tax=Rhodobium gokarnense TaxID=364296 RepID=A0ABT3H741_9HYPH|nr:glycosyltransferase family 2 protein [Rhodobium gokarnense]MCW2306203.1 glycosyltransferase involved in cell wall biosynthesis [Rhodobium gokarnense]
MARERPPVSICIPAYRAQGFIEETLDSVLAQTWPVDIAVSVDPSDDATAQTVRKMLAGRQARVVEQPQRLGWLGNCNAALALASRDHAMLMPHDDALDPDYVATCMETLAATPRAVLAFTDIDGLNKADVLGTEPSETGPTRQRVAAMFRRHFPAIAFRGVFSRKRARHHAVPRTISGFGADSLWVLRMAVKGDIVRIPGPLYHKRFHDQTAHQPWYRALPAERDEMWIAHCVEALRTVALQRPDVLLDADLRRAWRQRLARVEVRFHTPPGLPAELDPDRPLLPQAVRVYRRIARRTPPYSWS